MATATATVAATVGSVLYLGVVPLASVVCANEGLGFGLGLGLARARVRARITVRGRVTARARARARANWRIVYVRLF